MKITIDGSNVNKIGRSIVESSNTLIKDVSKLESIISDINTAWDGADELKYVNSMKDKYIKEITEFSKMVQKYGEYLQNVPGAYDLLDETFSNKNINV